VTKFASVRARAGVANGPIDELLIAIINGMRDVVQRHVLFSSFESFARIVTCECNEIYTVLKNEKMYSEILVNDLASVVRLKNGERQESQCEVQ